MSYILGYSTTVGIKTELQTKGSQDRLRLEVLYNVHINNSNKS